MLFNKSLILFSMVVIVTITNIFVIVNKNHKSDFQYDLTTNSLDNMPLVDNDPFASLAYGGAPEEQRSAEFRKWMSNGLKIKVNNGSGSGTIVYHNNDDGWAYVQSCGHLWLGNMNADEGKRRKVKCKVQTWYHNQNKLSQPREYKAEVLYYSNSDGRDVSLLRFKPDWEPNYLPIAAEDFKYTRNMRLHSVGCDGGREVAHYDVEVVGLRDGLWPDLVTTRNSPRPGRSGGGLSTEDFFVGVCWGTSSYSGDGNGYFTPLKTVREYNKMNGYGWLNEVGYSLARQIPIRDRNNPQIEYPNDYIPIPNR